jgi:malate/lactate dehydrogenase
VLGKGGVESIEEIELTVVERELLDKAAEHVRAETEKAKKMIEGKG